MLSPDLIESLEIEPPPPFKPLWNENDLPLPIINMKSSGQIMKRSCVWLLSHIGFDGASDQALSCLTDIAMHYFSNLSKCISGLVEKYLGVLSSEEILLETLALNGIPNPEDLETYLRLDIVRHGRRLESLRMKMDSAYKFLETGEDMDHLDDIKFESHNEQIISGNFFEDMGLDFLNLKDIGLDIRSVPLSLWNQKSEKPIRARVRRSLLTKYFLFI